MQYGRNLAIALWGMALCLLLGSCGGGGGNPAPPPGSGSPNNPLLIWDSGKWDDATWA